MEIVEGSYVKIDFGIERDTEFVESIGAIYQGMEGIVESFGDRYDSDPRIILIEKYKKRIEEHNLRSGTSWVKNPKIPTRCLVRLSKKAMLKNERSKMSLTFLSKQL